MKVIHSKLILICQVQISISLTIILETKWQTTEMQKSVKITLLQCCTHALEPQVIPYWQMFNASL